jgi:hypothetical protein
VAGNKGTPAAIEVEGAPQLRKAFKKLGGRTKDLSVIHGDIASVVEDRAVELVPHMTGALGDSIRSSKGATRASVSAGGRRLEPYAGPIHFGWRARNIEPQPFLYDALDDRRGEILKRYSEGIGDLVRKFDREAPD